MIIQVAKDIIEILEKNKLGIVSISTGGDNSDDKKAIERHFLKEDQMLLKMLLIPFKTSMETFG